MWAVKYFRHYAYGHHCKVYKDHEALKVLLNIPQPTGKLARWGQELDLEIQYRPGRANTHADNLSRYPVSLLQDKEVGAYVVAAVLQTADRNLRIVHFSNAS